MTTMECQEEILKNVGRNGKEKPWARHKEQAEYIAVAYKAIGDERKFERIMSCASYLGFKQAGEVLKLKEVNFCRVRLCPTCAWRRSLKTFGQMHKIISVAQKDYAFLHLVLTVKNVYGDQLRNELSHLSKSWDKFIKYKDVKSIVKGYYRATEVSHNVNPKSEWYDTFHPHFHCILAVNKSYFSGRTYLKKAKWVELWKKAARLNYEPNVYVERIKVDKNIDDAIAELSKYTTKFEDIIMPKNWNLTKETVKILDKALENKRFIAFGGVFKEIHKKLNLDDIEDGDLIQLDDESIDGEDREVIYYTWNSGYSQYIKVKGK